MATHFSNLIRTLLANSSIYTAIPFQRAYWGVIIMCHRVVADKTQLNAFPFTRKLWISTTKLQASFEYFLKQGYVLLSMAEAVERMARGDRGGKPFVVYTFDDGFVELEELVLPLFQRAGVPFTAFIPSGILTSNWVAWPYMLEYILKSQHLRHRAIEKLGFSHPIQRQEVVEQYQACLVPFVRANSTECANNLMCALEEVAKDSNSVSQRTSDLLSPEQVRRLAQSTVATVAGHTRNHLALDRLPFEAALFEITEGNRQISELIGQNVNFLSYPYGIVPPELSDAHALEMLKIHAAVTTEPVCVAHAHCKHLASLPRFALSEDVSFAEIDVRFQKMMDTIRTIRHKNAI